MLKMQKNDAYYDLGGSCKVDEDGNLDVTLTAMFTQFTPQRKAIKRTRSVLHTIHFLFSIIYFVYN